MSASPLTTSAGCVAPELALELRQHIRSVCQGPPVFSRCSRRHVCHLSEDLCYTRRELRVCRYVGTFHRGRRTKLKRHPRRQVVGGECIDLASDSDQRSDSERQRSSSPAAAQAHLKRVRLAAPGGGCANPKAVTAENRAALSDDEEKGPERKRPSCAPEICSETSAEGGAAA